MVMLMVMRVVMSMFLIVVMTMTVLTDLTIYFAVQRQAAATFSAHRISPFSKSDAYTID
jgi:hypothetical protein